MYRFLDYQIFGSPIMNEVDSHHEQKERTKIQGPIIRKEFLANRISIAQPVVMKLGVIIGHTYGFMMKTKI